jgi:hypothetical protein
MILELIHPGRGEQHRGVPARDKYIARTAYTPLGLEKAEVFFAKFVRFHDLRRLRLGIVANAGFNMISAHGGREKVK